MQNEPDNKDLWKFIAEFVGWTLMRWNEPYQYWYGRRPNDDDGPNHFCVPPYLVSVDSWLSEVWPAMLTMEPEVRRLWLHRLNMQFTDGPVYVGFSDPAVPNATAKQRCLALYSAINDPRGAT